MTDLERILSLANHGINKSPEARNTTKILKESYSPGDEYADSEGMVSNCCGAPMMDYHEGHGRCSDCKDMAAGESEEEYYESTEEVVAEAPKLTVSFKNFMQWFFSDSGEDEYAGFGEEAVAEINRSGSVTYTAQDMLNRSGYIPGHIVAGGDKDEEYDPADLTLVETEVTTEDESVARIRKLANVFSSSTEQPTVETVEQNEDKGNE